MVRCCGDVSRLLATCHIAATVRGVAFRTLRFYPWSHSEAQFSGASGRGACIVAAVATCPALSSSPPSSAAAAVDRCGRQEKKVPSHLCVRVWASALVLILLKCSLSPSPSLPLSCADSVFASGSIEEHIHTRGRQNTAGCPRVWWGLSVGGLPNARWHSLEARGDRERSGKG